MLDYILWDADPEIFTIGSRGIRWYGLLFAASFLVGYRIMRMVWKTEGHRDKALDGLVIYSIVGTILGARLGHCYFYEWDTYATDPIRVLKIWEGGLASHGAAIGIMLAVFLYVRRYKMPGFLWTIDRVVIIVALAGCFIRFGNFMNSEIIGKPTGASQGVIFARNASDHIQAASGASEVSYEILDDTRMHNGDMLQKMEVTLTYSGKNRPSSPQEADLLLDANITSELDTIYEKYRDNAHLVIIDDTQARHELKGGKMISTFTAYGIPRHPAQLYESLSCLVLFFLLLRSYKRLKGKVPTGMFFGIFCTVVFTLRFFYEFLKENQVAMENDMVLNMGQWLSIPMVAIGIFFVVKGLRSLKVSKTA